MFPAWVLPWHALIGAVLLSPIAFAAHALQVVDVVVWFALSSCDDVVDCPVAAF